MGVCMGGVIESPGRVDEREKQKDAVKVKLGSFVQVLDR